MQEVSWTLQAICMLTKISMFSDAAKNPLLGLGAVCMNSWTYASWPKGFLQDKDPSIEYLELFALLVGIKLWHKTMDS